MTNIDFATIQKEFATTLSSFEKASPEVIQSALSILQKEGSKEATLAGRKIEIQTEDPLIQTLLTKITTLSSYPEIKTWALEQGYDSLSSMVRYSLEHALWNHVEAKTALDPTYDPLIHFLKGSIASFPLPPNLEEAYLQLVEKIDQRLESLSLSHPKEWTETKADKENWPKQLQTMKESWNALKARVQTFPKAQLFSDNDAVRKEEYLKLALQFGLAFTGLREQGNEHLAFLPIPWFLQECKTGWDTQIRQLMSLGKILPPSDSALLSAWEASREVCRSLLEKALQKTFPSHASDVHYQTAAKHAGNELFSLGYSSQDLGPFEEDMVSLVKSLLTEAMLKLLEEEGPQELIQALIQRYPNLPSKESLFTYYLDAYEEEVQNNRDLVIDPCTKLVNVFTKLESLGKSPSPTKEFWEGLQECFHLCQEEGILSPSFSTRPQFERLIESDLKKTAVFHKHLKNITREELLELIKEPKASLQRLLRNASEEEVARVLDQLQEPLNTLKQSLNPEEERQDFEAVKSRALTYANKFPSVLAKINRSRLEHLFTDQNKLTPFGAYAFGLSSHVLKIQDCTEASNTKILQWIQEKGLPMQEQETLLQLLQTTVDQLPNSLRKEKIQEALKTKDLKLIQSVIHANPKYFTFEEMVVFGDADGIKEWLQTHTLSEQERGEAVISAAKGGHLPVIRALLENGSISEKDRRWAVKTAAENGHLPVIWALLENRSISENIRGGVVFNAAKGGHLPVIRALLENGSISEENRGGAVINAAKNRDLPMIRALLENGSISEENRGEAVRLAALYGHLPVIQALLENGTISENDRGGAVKYAAENRHLPVIQELLKNRSISENNRKWALQTAQEKRFEEIVELLKSKRPWWKIWGI